jgi:uncharacterized coiled-coil DUF342 family protein
MTGRIWPLFILLLVAACASTEKEEPELTSEQKKQLTQELEYYEGQKVTKAAEAEDAKVETEEVRAELEAVRRERENISRQIGAKIDEAKKLMEEIKKLSKELDPVTAEEEAAAEKLLLEAKFFQRDNPTEAASVFAAKYKLVIDRHPRTKAAQEAKKLYDELTR